MIGIVGGIGPYAGIDLMEKILTNTFADSDQKHVSVALLSFPDKIPDRSEFIEGKRFDNPAYPISKIIIQLADTGATIVGIACNTAHAPEIFNVILDQIEKSGSRIRVINMIEETVNFIKLNYAGIRKIGILSTNGTYKAKVYFNALIDNGFLPIVPELEFQEKVVHEAIYSKDYGIKANANNIPTRVILDLNSAIELLKEKGAECLILGCTEIPLVINELNLQLLPFVDPSFILARALIRETDSTKLRSLKP